MYGFNWAATSSSREGFDRIAALVAPGFEARMSAEVGGRTTDLEGMRAFLSALEQDFREFRYEPDDYLATAPGRVVAAGTIVTVARASRMPLSREFGHVWTLEDGQPSRVDAFLDRDAAMRAAGGG